MKKYPEGDFQKLTDQLIGALTSEKPRPKENCTNCGRPGHSDFNCWGDCPACGEQGHSLGTCQLSPEKIRAKEKRKRRRKKWAENKRLKFKMLKTQSKQSHPSFVQFILDCSTLPKVIEATQTLGPDVLFHLFHISRTWCYTLHRERLKAFGRWRKF